MGDCPRRAAIGGANRDAADDTDDEFDPSHGEKGALRAVWGVEGVAVNPYGCAPKCCGSLNSVVIVGGCRATRRREGACGTAGALGPYLGSIWKKRDWPALNVIELFHQVGSFEDSRLSPRTDGRLHTAPVKEIVYKRNSYRTR